MIHEYSSWIFLSHYTLRLFLVSEYFQKREIQLEWTLNKESRLHSFANDKKRLIEKTALLLFLMNPGFRTNVFDESLLSHKISFNQDPCLTKVFLNKPECVINLKAS